MSILKNSSIYLLGEIFSKSLPFLLIPYLARSLGAEGFGHLANVQAYIALLIIFIGLLQEGALTRYFYFYGKRSIGLVLSSGYIYSSMISILLIIFSLLTKNIILFYVTLASFSQVLLSTQLSLRQCQQNSVEYAKIQVLNGLVIVVTTVFLFEFLASTYENRVISTIFANLLSFVFSFYLYKKNENIRYRYSLKYRIKGLLYILSFGAPLIFHQMSFFMKGQFDRIIIYEYFSVESLGVYAAGYQLASIFSVILMALNKAAVPVIYEKLKLKLIDGSNFLKWGKYSLAFVLIPALIALLIPEYIYELILGDGFENAKYFTVIFLVGLSFNIPYLCLVNYLFYLGKNKEIAYCTFSTSLIYVLCIYLFSSYDIKLVPISLIISNILLVIILFYYVKKLNPSLKSSG